MAEVLTRCEQCGHAAHAGAPCQAMVQRPIGIYPGSRPLNPCRCLA